MKQIKAFVHRSRVSDIDMLWALRGSIGSACSTSKARCGPWAPTSSSIRWSLVASLLTRVEN
ncbi:MAG: hypothetical protein KDI75_10115 [Xanthomonadales bacterium]|nr:hypothetical protein [Xanthomonadales bacterium]